MTDVNLLIHGRTYGVGCDDGQEKRVRELGQYIDKRVREIAGAGGTSTEAHLLVLSCLVMADELFEARDNIQNLRNQIAVQAREIDNLNDQISSMENTEVQVAPAAAAKTVVVNQMDPETEQQLNGAIVYLSKRIETLAKRLKEAA